MMTCMPIRMCVVTDMMNSSIITAMRGDPRICTTAAWLRPSSATTMRTKAMVSGTLATAVRRWRQKCPVPDLAGPKPRTCLSGVLISPAISYLRPSARPSHEQVADDPDDDGQADRPDEAGHRQPFALVGA